MAPTVRVLTFYHAFLSDNASLPNPSEASRVSRTSSQVVVWLTIQSLSENVPCRSVDEMNAGFPQKMWARTCLLIFSRTFLSLAVSTGLIRKHTIPSDTGVRSSITGLASTYSPARAANSNPFDTARRNAAIPKVWIDIQTFNVRTERLSCRPRSEKFGWFLPHTVSWRISCRTANALSSVRTSFTRRQPASYGGKNHLCASSPIESARSIPRL